MPVLYTRRAARATTTSCVPEKMLKSALLCRLGRGTSIEQPGEGSCCMLPSGRFNQQAVHAQTHRQTTSNERWMSPFEHTLKAAAGTSSSRLPAIKSDSQDGSPMSGRVLYAADAELDRQLVFYRKFRAPDACLGRVMKAVA